MRQKRVSLQPLLLQPTVLLPLLGMRKLSRIMPPIARDVPSGEAAGKVVANKSEDKDPRVDAVANNFVAKNVGIRDQPHT